MGDDETKLPDEVIIDLLGLASVGEEEGMGRELEELAFNPKSFVFFDLFRAGDSDPLLLDFDFVSLVELEDFGEALELSPEESKGEEPEGGLKGPPSISSVTELDLYRPM